MVTDEPSRGPSSRASRDVIVARPLRGSAVPYLKLPHNLRLERGSPVLWASRGDPQPADTDGMKLCRSVLAVLILVGVFAATPAVAGRHWGRARCRMEVSRPPGPATRILHFIVAAGSHMGAVGVWKHRSRGSVTVRVDAGDKADKVLEGPKKRAYDLVRCEAR